MENSFFFRSVVPFLIENINVSWSDFKNMKFLVHISVYIVILRNMKVVSNPYSEKWLSFLLLVSIKKYWIMIINKIAHQRLEFGNLQHFRVASSDDLCKLRWIFQIILRWYNNPLGSIVNHLDGLPTS